LSKQKKRKIIKRSAIAKHYVEGNSRKVKVNVCDWGEPCCWACGYYSRDHKYDVRKSDKHWSACWDRADYLEKAHIIPFSLTEDDSLDNFVLLCKECHRKNPNTTSVEAYQIWLDFVPEWNNVRLNEYKEAIELFGLSLESMDTLLSEDGDGFQEFLNETATSVSGQVNPMTMVAAMASYLS
tara:strand:+ start:301 stop:846 length:546 start_codon:yes stop_codon:yes gene_type:complete